MDTELLKTFLEVEKTRHFGRAAENLYLTPAAVSARIKQLEGIIGLPLLVRDRKQIALTPAGERLKPRAQEVLEALARAVAEPSNMPRGTQRFAIGATPNLWDFLISKQLILLSKIRPELSITAECHDSGYLISQLQSRQIDVVFLFDPLELDGIRCEMVASVDLAMLATKERVSGSSLGNLNYMLVDWSVGFGIEHARVMGSDMQPALVASTGRIALKYLSEYGGAGYFPAVSGASIGGAPTLYPVDGQPGIRLDLHMLYLEQTRQGAIIDILKSQLAVADA